MCQFALNQKELPVKVLKGLSSVYALTCYVLSLLTVQEIDAPHDYLKSSYGSVSLSMHVITDQQRNGRENERNLG